MDDDSDDVAENGRKLDVNSADELPIGVSEMSY